MIEGSWKTPLGNVPIDSDLAKYVVEKAGLVDIDTMAHQYEHSIEVQLPFLQYLFPNGFKFVPICMMLQDIQTSVEIGKIVAEAAVKYNALIIASSDWTHYEAQSKAIQKDKAAIDAVLKLDPYLFQQVIEEKQVSACGYGPVTALVYAATILEIHPTLLSYHTSGDVTGDTSAVVGYAAASFEK
jgi:AmmeMemoRadiSam system protein B